MLPSYVLNAGCLALIAITIWIGSYYLPKHSQSTRSRTAEVRGQTSPQPIYYPNSPDHPLYPPRVIADGRPVPNSPQSVFRPNSYNDLLRRRQIERIVNHSRGFVSSRPGQMQTTTTHALVENWRRSILGLIALSESNLKSAEMQFKLGNESTAVELARTAVENMARALIHCCGGKPDSDPGQEEVLKMLSQRFRAETETTFENAVNKIFYVLTNQKAEQTLQIASQITFAFKRLILNNFGEEIQSARTGGSQQTQLRG